MWRRQRNWEHLVEYAIRLFSRVPEAFAHRNFCDVLGLCADDFECFIHPHVPALRLCLGARWYLGHVWYDLLHPIA